MFAPSNSKHSTRMKKGTRMMLRSVGRTLLAALLLSCAFLARAEPSIRVEASVRQSDGKILVVGQPSSGAPSISVGRLNADGTMDESFGIGGWTEYPWPTATEFRATAVAALADGRILVAARLDGQVALMRFETSGEPDPLWGHAAPGPVVDFASAGFRANAIVELPNGSLLA